MQLVYVLDKNGKPLMPTTRYCHVKKLLKSGKAVCINNKPFTIRLKYDTTNFVQDLTLGFDTGRENIGISVVGNDTCFLRINFMTSNKSVTKNMSERRQFRNERRRHRRIRVQRRSIKSNNQFKTGNNDVLRSKKECLSRNISYQGMEEGINCKVCKGKESKFNNRKRPDGWITPSARQLIQMYISTTKLISNFLPISNISIERVSFDFQKLANEDIKSWEYSKGPLYGFKDYKDYTFYQQEGKCLLCQCNEIEFHHHIIPRSKGGTDKVSNIAGLCKDCHKLVHTDNKYTKTLQDLKQGCGKQKVSLLNSCMDIIIEELNKLYPIKVTTGVETYHKRLELGLEKDHCNDAVCIALNDIDNFNLDLPPVFNLKRFKKKSNNNINQRGQRKYYYNGKLVAINRHKGFEQKQNSLEEYIDNFAKTHSKLECDRHFHELVIKPAKRTYTFHKNGIVPNFKCGDKFKYEKHNKIKGDTKTGIFVCTGLDINNNKIRHDVSKNKDVKYCKLLNHNCIQFV